MNSSPMAGLAPIGVVHRPGTEPVYALPMPPRTAPSESDTVEITAAPDDDTVEIERPSTDSAPDDADTEEPNAVVDADSTDTDTDTDTDEIDTSDTDTVELAADPDHADPGDADPGDADPGDADPDSTDPDSTDPDQADSETGPATEASATPNLRHRRTASIAATNTDTAAEPARSDADSGGGQQPRKAAARPPGPLSPARTIMPVWTIARPAARPTTRVLRPVVAATQAAMIGTAPSVQPAKTAPGRIRRSLALDGVRGIAVLAVVVYHFFGNAVRGGYLGVDIFFVLSGFLITSLLVREYGAKNHISLSRFWVRRARRILPAALTVLIVTTAVAGLIGGDTAVQLVNQFLGSAFFVNNWVQIAQSHSYFADTSPQITMHYWSLAIEEQFYVVWPLLFLGALWVARRLSSGARTQMRIIATVAALLAAGSVAAMVALYDPARDPSRVYFGSDTHSFGLLVGVTLALVLTAPAPDAPDSWPRRVSPRTAEILGKTVAPLTFTGLIALIFFLPDTSALTYQGGLLVACLLTACVVHTAVAETGPVAALLRVQTLRYLGERSFSLYLWHWPIVLFLRAWLQGGHDAARSSSWPDWTVGLFAAVLTLGVSELSYRYIETPFRRKGFRGVLRSLGTTERLGVPAAVLVGCLVVALFAGSALGRSPEKTALEQQLDHLADLQRQANAHPPAATPPPRPAPADVPALPLGRDITGVGDSVMLASSPALQARFPGIYIDAQVSRHYTGGEGVIENLRSAGTLRKFVVLGFGTNGQAFDGQLDRILSEIGPGHKIVLLVPYGPVDGIPQAAQQVLQYAPRHPDVFLAPWCQAAAAHPENLGPDGVHPMGPGTWMYADAVTTGLRQAVTGKRDNTITCPN
ncbi:acyltransferase family protein [Gordonia sp. DT219]|uniref:acyltransferase family protein n=1 Tax=Gordonia sp. DT219 TaxID=3416658 RepID=UPI003CF0C97B